MNKSTPRKSILLLSHNFSPEPTGIGKYNGEMMDWLCKNGYDTTIITTFPYYPFWKVQPPYSNWWYKKETIKYAETGATMEIYRCPIYVPNFPTGKKRIIQDFLFWPSKFFPLLNQILFKKKHDLLITIAPPFHLALMAFLYRRVRGGKVDYHIQDLQIEAARQLNIVVGATFFKFLYRVEGYILRKADHVSTISDGMVKKVMGKVDKKVLFFPNWADTSFFYPLTNRAEVKQKWNFKPEDFVCLYSGSIGEKQGLESILYAAQKLRDIEQIKFVVAGSGPYKPVLVKMAEEAKLTNVFFFPTQEKENFNAFLNMADLHLIIQKGNAGDLVMPSKLTTILAVGGACIATAAMGTSLYQVISDHNVGVVITSDDNDELTAAIKSCLNKDLDEMRQNARAYALKYLNLDNVMKTFLKDAGIA